MDNNKKDTKSLNLYKEFSTKYIKLSKKELNKIELNSKS